MSASAKLRKRFVDAVQTDTRDAAEVAYALAASLLAEGEITAAAEFANEAIALLRQVPTSTLEECATSRVAIDGVLLPDFLHEGVVRAAFAAVLTQDR